MVDTRLFVERDQHDTWFTSAGSGGRSRVHRGAGRLTHHTVTVMMAERDVVPRDGVEVLRSHRRGMVPRPVRLHRDAMSGHDTPAAHRLGRYPGQRLEPSLVFDHGSPPDHNVRIRYSNDGPLRVPEQRELRALCCEIEPAMHGIVVQRIVIAHEQDHRRVGTVELRRRPLEEVIGNSPVVEQVTGNQNDVDGLGDGEVDERRQCCFLGPGPARTGEAHVNISGVEHQRGQHRTMVTLEAFKV